MKIEVHNVKIEDSTLAYIELNVINSIDIDYSASVKIRVDYRYWLGNIKLGEWKIIETTFEEDEGNKEVVNNFVNRKLSDCDISEFLYIERDDSVFNLMSIFNPN